MRGGDAWRRCAGGDVLAGRISRKITSPAGSSCAGSPLGPDVQEDLVGGAIFLRRQRVSPFVR